MHIPYTSANRVDSLAQTPTGFLSGIGYKTGKLCYSTGTISGYSAGLPVDSNGCLVCDTSGSISYYGQGGVPLTSGAKVAASTGQTVVRYNARGMPLDANYKLALA